MSTFVAFILIFGTIVFFHELGHFVVAKLAGVKVYEFALGFGPVIVQTQPGETKYSLRIFPVGGFVKLAGMDESEDSEDSIASDDPRSFNNKSLFVRMATIAAGPFMNFFLAVAIFTIYFMIVLVPPTIFFVEPGFPADQAGLRPGDQFVTINNQSVESTEQIIGMIKKSPGQELLITVLRENETRTFTVVPESENGQGRLGIHIDDKPQLPFNQSMRAGIVQTGRFTQELIVSLVRMITGHIKPEIAGPIGIYQLVGDFAQQGIANLLILAAMLNINLGLLNLLPIPVLDGGWLVIFGFEAIRGRPLAQEHRGIAQFIGFALLLLLMVFATFKDLMRLDIFS